MHELQIIENKPAVLVANFDQVRTALSLELEKYNIVVTSDTVVDAKKLATELNSSKKVIKDAGKAAYGDATAPAVEFMSKVNELVDLVEQSRQTILAQVKKFEDETRNKVRALLTEYRSELWLLHKVGDEFKRAEIDDLILLSNLTKAENLSKSAKDTLEGRVRDDRSQQEKIDMRLVMLENHSFRAGLAVPLTRNHVLPFLFAEDNVYESQLQRIIASEVARQEAAENKLREQITKENEMRAPEVIADPVKTEPPAIEASPEPLAEKIDAQKTGSASYGHDSRIDVEVSAVFNTTVDSRITDEAISSELRRVLELAGVKTLSSITINRSASGAALTKDAAPKVGRSRPGDDMIVEVIASHYGVTKALAISWLRQVNLDAVEKRCAA